MHFGRHCSTQYTKWEALWSVNGILEKAEGPKSLLPPPPPLHLHHIPAGCGLYLCSGLWIKRGRPRALFKWLLHIVSGSWWLTSTTFHPRVLPALSKTSSYSGCVLIVRICGLWPLPFTSIPLLWVNSTQIHFCGPISLTLRLYRAQSKTSEPGQSAY